MTNPHARPGPVITSAEPQLFVTDLAASCQFFTDRLGFEIMFMYGEPPFYAQVRRQGARLNLRHVDAPVIDPHIRDRDDLLAASLTLADSDGIATLCDDFRAAGVTFHHPLRLEPWGARTFTIKDPDGNLLHFAAPGPTKS